MSLTRACGACGEMIRQEHHVELMAQVLRTDGPEAQDGNMLSDDYCDACLSSGAALKDLLGGLTNYRDGKLVTGEATG